MRPISPDDVAVYLYSTSASSTRWKPVTEHVEAESGGPLAQSLTTPRMAYLTRTAYREPATNPAHLTTLKSVVEIEEHLFSSYARRIRATPLAASRQRYTTKQVPRWLTTIRALSIPHTAACQLVRRTIAFSRFGRTRHAVTAGIPSLLISAVRGATAPLSGVDPFGGQGR